LKSHKADMLKKKTVELETSGLKRAEIKKQAKAYSENAASKVAALHNPDGFAGGKDSFDPKKIDKHIGDKGVNSSIGSQWAKALREEAVEAKKRGDTKMNTKLPRCK
jgi:hypothetical protein